MWLKDGLPFRTTPTNIPIGDDSILRSQLTFTVNEGDQGVYQAIFTDPDDSDSELLIAVPTRVDIGECKT